MPITLHEGDCLEILKFLPDQSVHSIVTDPPYGLSFMGRKWDYDVPSVEIWREVLRVLKPGGHLLSFAGTRTYHRMVVAIEDAGFEIRDQIGWLYGSGFPKSLDIGKAIDKALGAERTEIIGPKVGYEDFIDRTDAHSTDGRSEGWERPWRDKPDAVLRSHLQFKAVTSEASAWDGWGTALKPAWEPIVLARKPIIGTVQGNVQAYGCGAMNIDGCRVGTELRTYDLKGGENLNKIVRDGGNDADDAKGCGAYGTGAKQVSIGTATVTGRWPANVIHDGSDEVMDSFAAFGERKACMSPSKARPEGRILGGSRSQGNLPMDSGTAARYFYCAKASKAERAGSTHPTVKPVSLMRYLCKLVTPDGGTVLDPFAGTGTTGLAAAEERFNAILIEREPEYCQDIRRRLALYLQDDDGSQPLIQM